MKIKASLICNKARQYHFQPLPLQKTMTFDEAKASTEKMKKYLTNFRCELFMFHDRDGFRSLGYKNMPAFIKSCIHEITPRYANTLLENTKYEANISSSSEIGAIPFLALKLLKKFEPSTSIYLWLEATKSSPTILGSINFLRKSTSLMNQHKSH